MTPSPYLKTGRNCPRCTQPLVTANPDADHPFSEEDEVHSFCTGCTTLAYARHQFKEPST